MAGRFPVGEAAIRRDAYLESTLAVLHDERYEPDRSLRSEEPLLWTPPEGNGG